MPGVGSEVEEVNVTGCVITVQHSFQLKKKINKLTLIRPLSTMSAIPHSLSSPFVFKPYHPLLVC